MRKFILSLLIYLITLPTFAATVEFSNFTTSTGANRLCGYNDATQDSTCFTLGSGLAFSGTTLNSTGTGGTVTAVSVVTANGLAGTVANSTSTPAITLSTNVTGLVKGNGTAFSAATAGTDYVTAGSTNTFTNKSGNISQWTNDSGYVTAITAPVTSVFTRTGVVIAQSGDYNTSQVTENASFLYFTNARAIAAPLTGYSSGAGTISSADSIVTAFGKLNGNILALVTGVSSVSNSDSSLTFSPTTGAVIGSLNVANPNTWAALQAFPATDFQLLDATDVTKTGKFDLSTQATGTNTLFRLPTLGVTGTINLATINSVTQSFTGSTTFTSTFATNGTSSTLGGGTGAITANIGTGATLNATTKVVNVGTGGVSGSTTNIAIGSNVAGSLGTLTISSPTMNFGATNTRIATPDGSLRITNTADSTKQISFSATGITTATTRTWTSQDASGTVAYLSNNLGAFGATTSAQLASIISDETGTGVLAFATNPTLSGITITDATNIVLNTTTGTKIGTATGQKLGFYNATPAIQPTGDPISALTTLGLLATPTAITVPEGGTGAGTLTGLIKGNGTSAFTVATAGTDYVTPTGVTSLTNKNLSDATNTLSINQIATITGNTTLSASNSTVLVDSSTGTVTVTLPAASGCNGRIYNIKKIDSSVNTVIIDGNASETIDGALTQTIPVQWMSYSIQCNGTSWFIL